MRARSCGRARTRAPRSPRERNVALEHLSLEGGIGHDGGGAMFRESRGARRSDDGRDGTGKDADATAILWKVQHPFASGCLRSYARDTRRETRRWQRKPGRDSKRTVAVGDLGLAHEARAGGRAGGRTRALSCTRDLRERAAFALRAVTWEVTADMVLACGSGNGSSDRRLARYCAGNGLRAWQGRRRCGARIRTRFNTPCERKRCFGSNLTAVQSGLFDSVPVSKFYRSREVTD